MRSLIAWPRQTENLFEGFREMDNLLKRFFAGPPETTNGGAMQAWSPSCDVEETEKDFIVKADLPGVDPKNVEISVNEGYLTLRGEKKEEKDEKNKNCHRVERFVGTFYREIPLPAGADMDKIAATSAHGTITVTVPKTPGAGTKKIAIKAEK